MTAVLPSTGDANWQNLVDNWTEGDAEFLQDRLVQRVTNVSDFTLASLVGTTPGAGNVVSSIGAGRVLYNTTTKNVVVSTTGANAGLKVLLASSSIKLVDTGANAEILLTSGATGSGINFAATGITIGGPVTFTGAVTAPAFSASGLTSSGFLSVRAGNAAGLLVTDATSAKLNTTALADTSAGVRIATATGNVLNLNSPSGGNASLTIGGALTAGSVVSSSTISGTSISTSSGAIAALTGTTATMTGAVQGATVTSTGALNGVSAAVTGNATVGGTLGVTGLATFTAIPVGPGTDPTTANQLARKSYVDAGDAGQVTVGNTAAGYSNPGIGVSIKMVVGTAVVTTNSSGEASFSYGYTFPNGIIGVVMNNGDVTTCAYIAQINSPTTSAASFRAYLETSTSVVGAQPWGQDRYRNGSVRISFMAFGW